MTTLARWLFTAGVLLFIAVLASQGWGSVLGTLAVAGWGLVAVALFHLLPLGLDAGALAVLLAGRRGRAATDALLARWTGESANSLMPAGQLGGPVLMARCLGQRGVPMAAAAAAVTVCTTLQTFGQILFSLLGVLLLGAHASHASEQTLRLMALGASGFLGLQIVGFYLLQRRGMFTRLLRLVGKVSGGRGAGFMEQAAAIDKAVQDLYALPARLAACFCLNFIGWLVGTGEVFLILKFLGHPVGWSTALLLESLGQAVRGAAFAVPGALGVQEGGYLLLAPLAGLPTDTAVALSLAKRARELLLGLPGLLYLHMASRRGKVSAICAP